jgi:hypothetical protein
MSIHAKPLSWNRHGEPTLTITVEGIQDVYRFAHHLEHGQVEFCAIGRRVKRGLLRKLGARFMDDLLRRLHGSGWSYRKDAVQVDGFTVTDGQRGAMTNAAVALTRPATAQERGEIRAAWDAAVDELAADAWLAGRTAAHRKDAAYETLRFVNSTD